MTILSTTSAVGGNRGADMTYEDPAIIPAVVTDGTYPMPEHGWTCFHCGDTFMTPGAARDHFDQTPCKVQKLHLS